MIQIRYKLSLDALISCLKEILGEGNERSVKFKKTHQRG